MPYTGNPYQVVPDAMVAIDAPVSTTLMSYEAIDNPDWLKSAITDGANASQGISTSTLDTNGNAVFGDDLTLQGDTIDSNAATLSWNAPTKFSKGASFDGDLALMGVNLGFMSSYRILNGEV